MPLSYCKEFPMDQLCRRASNLETVTGKTQDTAKSQTQSKPPDYNASRYSLNELKNNITALCNKILGSSSLFCESALRIFKKADTILAELQNKLENKKDQSCQLTQRWPYANKRYGEFLGEPSTYAADCLKGSSKPLEPSTPNKTELGY